MAHVNITVSKMYRTDGTGVQYSILYRTNDTYIKYSKYCTRLMVRVYSINKEQD